jgi:hypothetical protein
LCMCLGHGTLKIRRIVRPINIVTGLPKD